MEPNLILQKLLNRSASREEVLALLDYIKKHPQEDFADSIREEWDKIELLSHQRAELGGIYDEVSRAIYAKEQRRARRGQHFIRWAATFTLLLMAAVGVYLYQTQTTPEVAVITPLVEKVNPKGQKSKIFLPDGSIVWLNAESRLLFPERFDSTRVVTLEGEAYFEVKSKPDKPFVVKAGSFTTLVLGTAFNVKAYQGEDKAQVALIEGKVQVAVAARPKKHILTPGLSLTYDHDSDQVTEQPFDTERVVGWKDGILIFKNSSREEIFDGLSRWYGVKFDFLNDGVGEPWNYTGHFENEYLEYVLTSIGSIKKFNYEIDNKVVKIIFN